MSASDVPSMKDIETVAKHIQVTGQAMMRLTQRVMDWMVAGDFPKTTAAIAHNRQWHELYLLWQGYQRQLLDLLDPQPARTRSTPIPKPDISEVEAQRGLETAHGHLRNIADATYIDMRECEYPGLAISANRTARRDEAEKLLVHYANVIYHWRLYKEQQAAQQYFTTGTLPDEEREPPAE